MQIKAGYSFRNIARLEEQISSAYSPVEITKLGDYDSFGFTGTVSLIGSARLELTRTVGSYGIRPKEPLEATTFVTVLNNHVGVQSRHADLRLGKGTGSVYHYPVDVKLSDGSEQLSLIVPNHVLQRRLCHLLDGRAGRPLQFDSAAFPVDAFRTFVSALEGLHGSSILQLAENLPGQSNGLEDLIVDSLILNFPNNNTDLLSKTPQISPRQVKRALELIHSSPHRHISPVTLAQVSGVSTRALQYAFKKTTGRTISEYQTALRIELACTEILRSAERSIEEIGRSLGFSSPSNFSQVFKKIYGVSPNKFRQLHLWSGRVKPLGMSWESHAIGE
ncbi:helix-turn-helix domain-containing protein [Rhizobium sp. SG2393]|uniref:helix-turn-helix domain-containing protein n=1 Tax=Rhizobium sp. SG2393 TaxID=3276279 RepID=UPI00366C7BC2